MRRISVAAGRLRASSRPSPSGRGPGDTAPGRIASWLCLGLLAVAGVGCDRAEAAQPAPVHRAADFRSSAVDAALDRATDALRTRGFAPDGTEWRGFLVDRASATTNVSMSSGTCYVILGDGSSAVRELDLRIFDSDGGEVAQDATAGAGAVLRYCPSQSGTYYLAARATAGSGLFGVRRFHGPTGLHIRLDDLFGRPTPPPDRPERP